MKKNSKVMPGLQKLVIAMSVLLAFLLAGIVYAATITVDTFSDGANTVSLTIPTGGGTVTGSDVESVTSGCIDTERDLYLRGIGGAGEAGKTISANVFPGTSRFVLEAGSGIQAFVQIEWDGNDGIANSIDYDGLGGEDLTGGDPDTNDGFHISLLVDDLAADITLAAYTDSTHWSDHTITTPGAIFTGNRLDVFLRFIDFTPQGSSGGVNWENVGALVLTIEDGSANYGLDIDIDLIELNDYREYGDLPVDVYGEAVLEANHFPQGLRLGTNLDTEDTYHSSADAAGDDTETSPDDEDGVAPSTLPWVAGSGGGEVTFRPVGCLILGGCYINGWIDWNNDGDFDDTIDGASEQIVNNYRRTGDAEIARSIDTPTTFSNNYYYARFRICKTNTACNSPTTTDVEDGEVEDYRWWLGPTDVNIASFTASGRNGAVSVNWATTNENDLVGFNLWRGDDAGDADEQLNGALIVAHNAGSPFGSSYSYSDEGLVNGATYYYWLEAIESGGAPATWQGPIDATPGFRFYLPLVQRR